MGRCAVILMMLILIVGCGGEQSSNESGARSEAPPIDVAGEQSRSAIPDDPPPPTSSDNLRIMAYADADASITELTLAAGDIFNVYTFAELDGVTHVNAAQYRLVLPAGITIIGEEKTAPSVLTMGSHAELFAMVFDCRAPGKFKLMKYTCRVEDGFQGGEFEVKEGVDPRGAGFIGFVSCGDAAPEQLSASGSALTLRLKS